MMPTSEVFKPTLSATIGGPEFDMVVDFARQYKGNPNNMQLRSEIIAVFKAKRLPLPTFPQANEDMASPFMSLHEAIENKAFAQWLASAKRIIWHEHKGVHYYHVNCTCPPKPCWTKFDCVPQNLPVETWLAMQRRTIKYRGEFWVRNPRLERCLASKIENHNGKIRLVQAVRWDEFCYLEIG